MFGRHGRSRGTESAHALQPKNRQQAMTPVSRRTVTKGAAWAAPVVVIGGTAPAFAASGWTVWFESLGIACKLPGASCDKETGITRVM